MVNNKKSSIENQILIKDKVCTIEETSVARPMVQTFAIYLAPFLWLLVVTNPLVCHSLEQKCPFYFKETMKSLKAKNEVYSPTPRDLSYGSIGEVALEQLWCFTFLDQHSWNGLNGTFLDLKCCGSSGG